MVACGSSAELRCGRLGECSGLGCQGDAGGDKSSANLEQVANRQRCSSAVVIAAPGGWKRPEVSRKRPSGKLEATGSKPEAARSEPEAAGRKLEATGSKPEAAAGGWKRSKAAAAVKWKPDAAGSKLEAAGSESAAGRKPDADGSGQK